jgi:hypothetical protein
MAQRLAVDARELFVERQSISNKPNPASMRASAMGEPFHSMIAAELVFY